MIRLPTEPLEVLVPIAKHFHAMMDLIEAKRKEINEQATAEEIVEYADFVVTCLNDHSEFLARQLQLRTKQSINERD